MKNIVIYLTGMNASGGKERVVSNLIREWSKRYQVTLLVKDVGETFYDIPNGVNFVALKTPFVRAMFNMKHHRMVRMFFTFLNMFFSAVALSKQLKRMNYDYIYVTTPLNAYESYLAIREIGQKLVVSEHASINAYNSIYSWMKKKVYPKAYCVSVPNRMDTEQYIEWGCNAIYIPHLVTYPAEKKNELNSKIVLNVGRLTADKQQDKLINMWSEIKEKNGWTLWIVGDGEDRERLELLIEEKGVSNSIKLLRAQRDIQTIYRQASLFAFTSRSEGFGMVLIEAMSFGIPCISFDCPSGPRDVIINETNGFLIENGNDDAFCKKLQSLLVLRQDKLNALGDNAFEFIKNWDNEKIISDWEKVFV